MCYAQFCSLTCIYRIPNCILACITPNDSVWPAVTEFTVFILPLTVFLPVFTPNDSVWPAVTEFTVDLSNIHTCTCTCTSYIINSTRKNGILYIIGIGMLFKSLNCFYTFSFAIE